MAWYDEAHDNRVQLYTLTYSNPRVSAECTLSFFPVNYPAPQVS